MTKARQTTASSFCFGGFTKSSRLTPNHITSADETKIDE
jgi:hypothetical protein